MAIVTMNKFTLLTFHAHKQALLKQLQVFGDAHIITPSQDELEKLSFMQPDVSQEELSRYEVELEKVHFALERIKPYAPKPKMGERRPQLSFEEFDRYAADYDYATVYQKVKEQDDRIAASKAEAARCASENDVLQDWRGLDVAPGELAALEQTGYLLGTVNKETSDDFLQKIDSEFELVYAEPLTTGKDDTTLLLLFPAEMEEDLLAAARESGFTKATFQLRGKPETVIAENQKRIEELEREQRQAEAEIREFAPEYGKLQIAVDYFETALERERTRRNFVGSDTTLLMQGWIPAEDSEELRGILDTACSGEYFLQEEQADRDESSVPIKLKNNKFVSAFESITGMYAMPHYNELDPTPILAPFYWLFFGMMVGDVGYGLVLLLGTTLALKFLDLKASMRDFMKFFRYLSISIILMGFVYGGIFGVTFFEPIPIYEAGVLVGRKTILDNQTDITLMLVISIVIGLVHLFTGLITKAYICFRDGKPIDAFADGLLWILALCTGIGWLLTGTGLLAASQTVVSVCMWGFWISLLLLAIGQGRNGATIAGKIGTGLWDGVYGITGYVGDIVSYTRLVALALSGSYIAYAFNLMTGLVVGEFPGNPIILSLFRLLFGIVVVVFGQALNLGLSLLGAYVHTCRLQYVEFFGKFYEGGGLVFRPLALKNEYIHIKK